jgi:phenolic acid decarboxylase
VFHIFIIFAAVLVLWPMMARYISITQVTGMRHFEELQNTISRPVAYFFTHVAATTWKSILSQHSQFAFDEWWVHFMFMGVIPWLGIIAGITLLFLKSKNIDKRSIKIALLTLFLCLLFSTNFNGFTLYKLIYALPGFSSMRSIDRFINIESFVFILLMFYSFYELTKINSKWKYIIYSLPILVIVDNRIDTGELKRYDKVESQQKIAAARKIIHDNYNGKSSAVALMVNNNNKSTPGFHDKLIEDHITIIMAAQAENVPVVNAYTGHYPDNYMAFFDNMTEQTLIDWCNTNHTNEKDIQRIYAPIGEDYNWLKSYFKTDDNLFLSIDDEQKKFVLADNNLKVNSMFYVNFVGENRISILANNNMFVCAELMDKNQLLPNRKENKGWETFDLTWIDKEVVALKAANNKYVSINKQGEYLLTASADSVQQGIKLKWIILH